jgi:COMPASS component SWD3
VFRGHENHVFSVDYSPRANVVATGSSDETVRLWDVRSQELIRVLPAHSDPVTSVCFSPDGSTLASCSYDGLCRLWDVASGECLMTLVDDASPAVASARFSPNGRYLLLGTLDSRLRLWDVARDACIRTFTGHTAAKFCAAAAFLPAPASAPDGAAAYVAAGSEDGALLLWDVQTAAVRQRIDAAHAAVVLSVDAHPFRDMLASTAHDADTKVKVWADPSRANGLPALD